MTAPDQVLTPPPVVVKRLKSPASLALAEVYAGVAFPGPDERTRPTPGV